MRSRKNNRRPTRSRYAQRENYVYRQTTGYPPTRYPRRQQHAASRRPVNRKRKLNKKKVALVAIIFLMFIFMIIKAFQKDDVVETSTNDNTIKVGATNGTTTNNESQQKKEPEPKEKKEITDWRLILANYDNILPEDLEIELADIDDTRQFDARAIKDLKKMINAMGRDGITNVWVQSAYRSVARQKELYEDSIKKYLKQGKTQEEAERLTDEYINKPGSSDHNLGLAVDFNYVDNNFEDLDGFKWLRKNAENYGFILRYPKDKEDITKISYESWHWRYVGKEHAIKMNELNMCLEEYIEYLQYAGSEGE